jgi:hypothetical protein
MCDSAPARAQRTTQPPDAESNGTYAKIEVKSRLTLKPDYKFDSKRSPAAEEHLGAALAYGPLGPTGSGFELLILEEKQYQIAKANDGKMVVIVGNLETALYGGFLGRPINPYMVNRWYIRVREIRPVDAK